MDSSPLSRVFRSDPAGRGDFAIITLFYCFSCCYHSPCYCKSQLHDFFSVSNKVSHGASLTTYIVGHITTESGSWHCGRSNHRFDTRARLSSDRAVPDAFPCKGWNAAIGAAFQRFVAGQPSENRQAAATPFLLLDRIARGLILTFLGQPVPCVPGPAEQLLPRILCRGLRARIGRRCGSNRSCHEWHSGQKNSTTPGGRKIPTIGSSSARFSNHWNPPRSPNVSCHIGRPSATTRASSCPASGI